MPEIPDLSKLKNGQQPPPPTPEQPTSTRVRTAFLVIVGADGNIVVSADVAQEIEFEHPVTTDELYSACSLIIKDITVQQTAGLVSQGLLQMGSLMQRQAQDQAIASRLNLK